MKCTHMENPSQEKQIQEFQKKKDRPGLRGMITARKVKFYDHMEKRTSKLAILVSSER